MQVLLWGDEPCQDSEARFMQAPSSTRQETQAKDAHEKSSAEPALEPLSEVEGTSALLNSKPGINELLSVIKYTWKMARRHK